MIFFPDNLLYIAIQMLLQKISVAFLFQKTGKKLIHVMKHILQRFVQSPGIHQRCL